MTITQPSPTQPSPAQPSLADLHIHGAVGNLAPDQTAWLPSFPSSISDEELRHELETKGVVHIKNVMPREFVLEARRKYFSHMASTGMLREGSDPVEGLWRGGDADGDDWVAPASAGLVEITPKREENLQRAWEVPRQAWAKEFCGNEYLMDMVKRLNPTWTTPFIMKRQIWRTNIPHARGQSIGVHYDYIFLRHGPPNAMTAWVPVGDCEPRQGGLIYLENSCGIGDKIEAEFTARAKAGGLTEEEAKSAFNSNMMATGLLSSDPGAFAAEHGGHRWLVGNYEAGDVVFHSAMMLHAASVNIDPLDRIRLSCDLRFGDREGEYDARWDADIHRAGDGI